MGYPLGPGPTTLVSSQVLGAPVRKVDLDEVGETRHVDERGRPRRPVGMGVASSGVGPPSSYRHSPWKVGQRTG